MTKAIPTKKIIEQALSAWSEGRLVAIPTETVYGLGAPVNREDLVGRIFSVKERPFFDPLIVHVSSVEMAKGYAAHWSDAHQKLAEDFWPGPLTIVVKKNDLISELITAGLDTVGLRMPNNELTLKLIAELGCAVAAPSANKFTKTSPTCADHVRDQFREEDVMVIGSHPAQVGIESTIVSLEGNVLNILRPGIITSHDLQQCLGGNYIIRVGKTAFEAHQKDDAVVSAPGQLKAHYRPDYPLSYEITDRSKQSWKVEFPDCEFKELSSDPYITARELYAAMRTPLKGAVAKKCFLIPKSINLLPAKELEVWQGILNRLSKATTF